MSIAGPRESERPGAQGFLGSAMGGEDGFGLAVHVKGFGSWLRCSIHSWIAFSSSVTLWKTPRSSEALICGDRIPRIARSVSRSASAQVISWPQAFAVVKMPVMISSRVPRIWKFRLPLKSVGRSPRLYRLHSWRLPSSSAHRGPWRLPAGHDVAHSGGRMAGAGSNLHGLAICRDGPSHEGSRAR